MSWTQVRINNIKSTESELLEDTLTGLGALAVTFNDCEDNPIYEPDVGETPLWNLVDVTGLFELQTDTSPLSSILHRLPFVDASQIKIEVVEDQRWECAWMDQFKAMQFGSRLWVCPHHDVPEVDESAVVMKLDPGVAFGTGTHPTTHLCLEWLDQRIIGNERVIDFGCGSGILGIAAILLGAKDVWATDIDEQALSSTRMNAEMNEVSDAIMTSLPMAEPSHQADVLVANILANPLITLAPQLQNMLRTGGLIALSGILAEQKDEVIAAYSPFIDQIQTKELDGWVIVSGIKANS